MSPTRWEQSTPFGKSRRWPDKTGRTPSSWWTVRRPSPHESRRSGTGLRLYAFLRPQAVRPHGYRRPVGKKELLEQLPPWMGGGEMIKEVTFEKTVYNDIPFKYEAGTPNIEGPSPWPPPWTMSPDWGCTTARMNKKLTDMAVEGLKAMPRLTVLAPDVHTAPSFPACGGHPSPDLGTASGPDGNCRPHRAPLLPAPHVRIGNHGNHFRASFALYNTEEEVETFLRSMNRALEMSFPDPSSPLLPFSPSLHPAMNTAPSRHSFSASCWDSPAVPCTASCRKPLHPLSGRCSGYSGGPGGMARSFTPKAGNGRKPEKIQCLHPQTGLPSQAGQPATAAWTNHAPKSPPSLLKNLPTPGTATLAYEAILLFLTRWTPPTACGNRHRGRNGNPLALAPEGIPPPHANMLRDNVTYTRDLPFWTLTAWWTEIPPSAPSRA